VKHELKGVLKYLGLKNCIQSPPTQTVSENLSTPSQIVQISLKQLFHVSRINPSGIVLTAFIPIVEGQRPDLSLDHFLKLKLSEKNSRLTISSRIDDFFPELLCCVYYCIKDIPLFYILVAANHELL